MSKHNHNAKQNTRNNPDRFDWIKDCKGIPSLQESSIEVVLKPKQKVEIPLSEYRAFVETAFAVKMFKKRLKTVKYSSEVEELAKAFFGEDEPENEASKDGDKNDG